MALRLVYGKLNTKFEKNWYHKLSEIKFEHDRINLVFKPTFTL